METCVVYVKGFGGNVWEVGILAEEREQRP
jgi:hypothetical protein